MANGIYGRAAVICRGLGTWLEHHKATSYFKFTPVSGAIYLVISGQAHCQ